MKVGDLVNFHTSGWVFAHAQARYKNPGVVIEDRSNPSSRVENGRSYLILWADQKLTVEHFSYLKLAKENENR